MKKLLLLLILATSAAFGQTTTSVTGTVKDLSNTAVTSGQVSFTLQPGIDTSMSGTARFAPSEIDCTITGTGAVKALDGVSACTGVNNTAAQPSGPSYKVCIQPQFIQPGSCFVWYATGGSVDITQQVPTPPLTPAYNLVDTFSNQTIGGNKTFSGNLIYSGGLTTSSVGATGPISSSYVGSTNGTFIAGPIMTTVPAGFIASFAQTNQFVHRFADEANVAPTPANGGYASFSAAPAINLTTNTNHYNGYQFFPTLSGSNALTSLIGFESAPVINTTSPQPEFDDFYVQDWSGTGTVTLHRGIFIAPLTKAATNY